jgi:hypothetical protein
MMGMNTKAEVIPFGKYKGQEVEHLLGDDKYIEWLLAQPWFKQRYGNLYTVIINNYGQQPVETPTHNAMQVKFLREEHRLRFLVAAHPEHISAWTDKNAIVASMRSQPKAVIDLTAYKSWPPSKMISVSRPEFEDKGIDVFFSARSALSWDFLPSGIDSYLEVRIELKPSMGDDFPEVLRQMKRNGARYLLLQQYQGEGATEDEVIDFFGHDHRRVLFERNLETVSLPILAAADLVEEAERIKTLNKQIESSGSGGLVADALKVFNGGVVRVIAGKG